MTEWLERVRGELAGRYRIERELGRGSTATVYLADDLAQQRQVAVKVLHPELVQAVGGQRFLREIRLAASLHHPHLMAIHDSGEANGLFYFVAPYLPDGSLRTLLNRERQLSVDEAMRIAREIADALSYVHEHGIVHRDVKPENILFAGKHACVADFGIARAIEVVLGDTLTSTGLVVGTPAYMSPEQASGERAVDARSDQYSLACVLYEMIAGIPPFVGATAQSVISQRFAHPPSPLTFYRPNLPAGIEAAVARALSVAPADRFDNVGDFVAALDRRAPPVARIDPAMRLRKLQRRWFVAGASAALVVLALFGFNQARERMLAARMAAIDTARFVVLPFADSAGTSTSGIDAAELVRAALSQWRDLELVPTLTVQDRVEEQGTRISSLDDALDLAEDVGAGRAVWGRVSGRESDLRLALYDVPTRRALHEIGPVPIAGDTAERLIASMTNRLLRGAHFTSGVESGELGTRLLAARRAYERGHSAFEKGDFTAAFQEFSRAAAIDNGYAHAHLWAATTGLLLGSASDWQEAARRAISGRSTFDGRESVLAAAVAAMADGRYVEACVSFDAARRLGPLDFISWYGAGECRYHDDAVVRSNRSPSSWVFRSSYHTAANAYLRAVELDRRAYRLPVHDRISRILGTQMGVVRQGHDLTPRHTPFAAYPEIVEDTLAFFPYPIIGHALTVPESRPRDQARAAVERNANLLLRFAYAWARHEPHSADALHAVAAALEAQGELSEVMDRSALTFIRRARALRASPHTALQLGTREVRLLVKAGHFAAARSLADSLLSVWQTPTPQAADLLDGLAALTGRVNALARFNAMLRSEEVAGVRLPSSVREKAAVLDAHAAVGICDQIETRYAELLSDVDRYLPPGNAAAVKSELVADAAMWSAPCPSRAIGLTLTSARNDLVRAQRAFASGRRAEARAILDRMGLRRGVSPAAVSLDHAFQRAWLRAALGDTSGAIRQLDLSLGGLVAQRPSLVARPAEAAALPRSMMLRAELAAGQGDGRMTKYWANAALELWRNAEPELSASTVRLNQLARHP